MNSANFARHKAVYHRDLELPSLQIGGRGTWPVSTLNWPVLKPPFATGSSGSTPAVVVSSDA